MVDRRPLYAVAGVLAVVLVVVAFVVGRSTAPADNGGSAPTAAAPSSTQTIGGVIVGVDASRAGALAASDNYVAQLSQNVLQDPGAYNRLMQTVAAPSYRAEGIRDGDQTRRQAARFAQIYANGGKTVTSVVARRLDSFGGNRARVTSWASGVTWGGGQDSQQSFALYQLDLGWDGQRWLITGQSSPGDAPAPARIGIDSDASTAASSFDRTLKGMLAPVYGGS